MDELITVETKEEYWQQMQKEMYEMFVRLYEIPDDVLRQLEDELMCSE